MSSAALPAASSSSAPRHAASAILAAAGGLLAVALLAAVGIGGGMAIPAGAPQAGDTSPSTLARSEIPPPYLRLYELAAQRYGVDWAVLAGIGKVECDHGRDPDPSCTREGVTNAAGAGGPMQFLASTWAQYGVDADGAGRADRWDPADAIYSAANYLRAAGAPQNYQAAIFAYNHARWYVQEVQRWASRYRGARAAEGDEGGSETSFAREMAAATATPVLLVAGTRALLDPDDGHVALIPTGAPPVVQAMLVAGNELQGVRYGPGGHPDPRGVVEEDCSSTVNYVLYRSGVRPLSEILADNPLAQDYVDWGLPGPGRWVSIYATTAPTDHVFIVIAGLRLDTSHAGTDEGPNRDQDGPRWRLLDHIPTWARWSVRHPPGL